MDRRLREAARQYQRTQSPDDWEALRTELRRAGQVSDPQDVADAVVALFAHRLPEEDDVADVIAETNAVGFHADEWTVRDLTPIENGRFQFTADVHLSGDQLDDKGYVGDEISTEVRVSAEWTGEMFEVVEYELVHSQLVDVFDDCFEEPDTSYYDAEDYWEMMRRAWVQTTTQATATGDWCAGCVTSSPSSPVRTVGSPRARCSISVHSSWRTSTTWRPIARWLKWLSSSWDLLGSSTPPGSPRSGPSFAARGSRRTTIA
ncbi:MAG: hypothetical protein M9894_33005 [Planctomycetes bacterium]|nr:hypothetical protein [Planctomycetota bacterium]